MSFICCCCFDDDLNEALLGRCNDDHITCNDCIRRGIENAIGEMREFKCPDSSNCTHTLSERTIDTCVTDTNLKRAYFNICTSNELRNIDGLHSCTYCNYATIIEETDEEFYCVTCEKLYCVSCKQDIHEGVCLTEIDRETERQISAISIRCCSYPPIVKIDACNHVTCLCGTEWCWYCKGTRFVSRVNVRMCTDNCDLYNDPRGFTINVSDEQVAAGVQIERVRVAAQRDININATAERAQEEHLRIQQEHLQHEELELTEKIRIMQIVDTQHRELQVTESAEHQAAKAQLRIDTQAVHVQRSYVAQLVKKQEKAQRKRQNITNYNARAAAIARGNQLKAQFTILQTQHTAILDAMASL